MHANDRRARRGQASVVGGWAVLLLAALAAPGGAVAEVKAAGGAELRLGLGGGSPRAPEVLVGGGLAILDDGATRLDVQGHLAFSGGYDFDFQVPGVAGGVGHLQTFGVIAEVTGARRYGRIEPWAGLGLSVMNAGGDFAYECYTPSAPGCAGLSAQSTANSFEGRFVAAPSVAGGVRFAITDALLVEATVRWIAERESEFEELPIGVTVGGFTGMASFVWRMPSRPIWMRPAAEARPAPTLPAPPTPTTARPAPTLPTPTAPTIAPALCPVHDARRFRCYDDPVRGGYFCEPGAVAGEFPELSACEAACRGGAQACLATGALGAACERCVADCAASRNVACPGEAGAPR